MEMNDEMRELISYFKDNKIAVHIEKGNGRFYNGVILEFEGDMLVLDDRKLGAMPIYLIEINYIEKMAGET